MLSYNFLLKARFPRLQMSCGTCWQSWECELANSTRNWAGQTSSWIYSSPSGERDWGRHGVEGHTAGGR